jgi:hypothetical protein
MTDSPSRVLISISDGRVEIEGSEAFVASQLEQLRPMLQAVADRPAESSAPHPKPTSPASNQVQTNVGGLASYENLFAVADDKIQVLKDLPGSNSRQRTVTAALLLTLANTLHGQDTTSFDEIRDLCKTHGCLDSPNFAKTLKSEKDAFIFGGTPRKQTVKLTVPGKKRADTIADALKN